MSIITKAMMQGAAGTAASNSSGLCVEDVFSTKIYKGSGHANTKKITNNINLLEEGGLVWIKARSATIGSGSTASHVLMDTETGGRLRSNNNNQGSDGNSINLYTDGFDVTGTELNYQNDTLVSWTFRKAEGFLDIVTYIGDGTLNRQIPHNLNSNVGMVIVKAYDTTGSWNVNHRSNGKKNLVLNESYNSGGIDIWGTHTSSHITLCSANPTDYGNATGVKYVAYIFAHNDGDGKFGETGDQDIIKCGSYTGGTADLQKIVVDLGFEPQWVMIKSSDRSNSNWVIIDTMRGWYNSTDTMSKIIFPNQTYAEDNAGVYEIYPTSRGMHFNSANHDICGSNGNKYLYVAIRRGNMRQPKEGTDVYNHKNWSFNAVGLPSFQSNTISDPDLVIGSPLTAGNFYGKEFVDRVRGINTALNINSTTAQVTKSWEHIDPVEGKDIRFDLSNGGEYIAWNFKRAYKFFDIVVYSGNSTIGHEIKHNLGTTPEFFIVRGLDFSPSWWWVYHKDDRGGVDGAHSYMRLNNELLSADGQHWKDYRINDQFFTVDNQIDVNGSGKRYVAYLFASVPNVSKAGVYIGSQTDQVIDCGFSNGARFVLIKRSVNNNQSTNNGDWIVYDSLRGITTNVDPFIRLNEQAAQTTSGNQIFPHPSGFGIHSTSDNVMSVGVNGVSYIYLAIA